MDLEFKEGSFSDPNTGLRPMVMHVYSLVNKVKFEIIDTHGVTKSFYMDASSFAQLLDSGKDWLQSIQNQ